ncbi:MAG: recombinase family protein [Deltaproteobacteria bacterium]|nr:recombinase family protein [Deltaproteobacteria bacterium]
MPSTRRVALYARVSTSDQRADLQLHDLRRLAEQRGWKVVGEYVDLGVSGAKDRRPELDRLVKDAHKGRFDVLAIWKLDRLARSVRHLIMLGDEMRALGVDLVSVQDTLDTTTPSGRFTFHVLGAVAELERELIRERTVAGVAAAKRRGVRLGRPGFALDPGRVRALREEGRSFRAIAIEMGVSVGKVHETLAGRRTVRKSPSNGSSADARFAEGS